MNTFNSDIKGFQMLCFILYIYIVIINVCIYDQIKCSFENFADNYVFNVMVLKSSTINFLYKVIMRLDIMELFALCKSGNFNIHIWAWFGCFIC